MRHGVLLHLSRDRGGYLCRVTKCGGVFHAKGLGSKSSLPPSKIHLLPSTPKENKHCFRDISGILQGCSGPLWMFKKFVPKSLCSCLIPYYQRFGKGIGGRGWRPTGPKIQGEAFLLTVGALLLLVELLCLQSVEVLIQRNFPL